MALLPTIATAQQTLIGEEAGIGGFGGPSMAVTQMMGRTALLLGGSGGVVLDHAFSIGICGYGLASSIHGQGSTADTRRNIDLGLGGLQGAWSPGADQLVHPTFRLMVGLGGVDYRGNIAYDTMARKGAQQGVDVVIDIDPSFDVFFVAQPGVGVELNVLPFMRIEGALDYRFVSGVELEGIGDAGLSETSASLTFKFGSF